MTAPHPAHSPDTALKGLRVQLLVLTAARLVLNTGHRMIYPFLPTFARGLGVDLGTVALAVTARSALGLGGPIFGMLADRHGRRVAMLTGLGSFTTGMLLVTLWPSYPALMLALVLGAAAKLFFDSALQAHIGDRAPYARRGLAIALTELSWSGAFLLGMPVIGWLIARSDRWYAPFPLLGTLGLLALALVWRMLPHDGMQFGARPSFREGMNLVIAHPYALAALAMSALISASNETIVIVYGAWMEDAFALKVTALGASAVVIGVAELIGEGAVAGFVDRLGKRRAIAVGIGLNTLTVPLLPLLGFRVEGALVGLFLFFLTFEFAIVSLLPLMTELVPSARGTLMAGNAALLSAGRMVGALLGPQLFVIGLGANVAAAVVLDVLALAALLLFVRQQ